MPGPDLKVKKAEENLSKRITRSSAVNKIFKNVTSKGKTANSRGLLSVKNENEQYSITKRKAEKSPFTDKLLKRSAFGDITNATEKENNVDAKKGIKKPVPAAICGRIQKTLTKSIVTTKTTTASSLSYRNPTIASTAAAAARRQTVSFQPKKTDNKTQIDKTKPSILARPALKTTTDVKTCTEVKEMTVAIETKVNELKLSNVVQVAETSKRVTRLSARLSDILASSSSSSGEDSSLYVSALEELNITEEKILPVKEKESPKPPPGVDDFDKENWDDPHQLSHYAYDIFNYLKSREVKYKIPDYMDKQPSLNIHMRALLVDWMVAIQDDFELTHESLYLAVKIVDKFLSKVTVSKDNLQLVGATAIFVASKYDEQSPPLLDDIVYLGDKSYTDRNVILMEISILKQLNFDLGFPLSYRFLRRYARCSKAKMELLTLARFILEYALMDYSIVTLSDSKTAAAALHVARIMKKIGSWNSALEYYSGYKLHEFKDIAILLNDILHKKPRASLAAIRNKYSHEIFFAVSKAPLVDNSEL